ncbi:hypothetical protein [uncultured Nostoc sp.]
MRLVIDATCQTALAKSAAVGKGFSWDAIAMRSQGQEFNCTESVRLSNGL